MGLQPPRLQTIADFFRREVIARHGCPKEVLSDNGGEFLGEFDKLLQDFRIDHKLSSPNHPQTNGLVERFNGTLCSALRKCVGNNPRQWDQLIPTVLMGYRSSVQASTRFSPFFMLYARHATLYNMESTAVVDLEQQTPEQAADILLDRVEVIKEIASKAVDNIDSAQEKQRRDYQTRRKHVEPTTLKVGDHVVIKAKAPNSKLAAAAGPKVYLLDSFADDERTIVVVRDNGDPPKRWRENVANIALYKDMTAEGA